MPDLAQVTVGITTFNRPESLLRALESVAAQMPGCPVLVSDNGSLHADRADSRASGVRWLDLPFDAGLSACRNALADALETPYLLLMEDDMVLTENSRIERLVGVLAGEPCLGIVGGSLFQAGRIQHYARTIRRVGADVIVEPATGPLVEANGASWQACDMTFNFGLWRRECLADHRWDDSLKLAEHLDYFMQVQQAGRWRVAHCPGVVAAHDRNAPGDYKRWRHRPEFMRRFRNKWSVVRIRSWQAEQEMPRSFMTQDARDRAREAIRDFHELMPSAFACFGTLLGLVREGDVIAHDQDVDFGYISHAGGLPNPSIITRGPFKLQYMYHHHGELSEYAFDHENKTRVDLFRFKPHNGALEVAIYPDEFPQYKTVLVRFSEDDILPLGTHDGFGFPLPVPHDPEKWLETNYGPDWRIPDPGWDYRTGVRRTRPSIGEFEPCQCPQGAAFGGCPKFPHKAMKGRTLEICQGVRIDPDKRLQYLAKWGSEARNGAPLPSPPAQQIQNRDPHTCPHRSRKRVRMCAAGGG